MPTYNFRPRRQTAGEIYKQYWQEAFPTNISPELSVHVASPREWQGMPMDTLGATFSKGKYSPAERIGINPYIPREFVPDVVSHEMTHAAIHSLPRKQQKQVMKETNRALWDALTNPEAGMNPAESAVTERVLSHIAQPIYREQGSPSIDWLEILPFITGLYGKDMPNKYEIIFRRNLAKMANETK